VLQLGPPPARETRAARPRPGVPRTVTDDVVEESCGWPWRRSCAMPCIGARARCPQSSASSSS